MSNDDIEAALSVNAVQRTPCVLVLDTSGSMQAQDRIGHLNQGLKQFEKAVKATEALRQRVLLMVIGFGESVRILADWTPAADFAAPELQADGMTPLGEAMTVAHEAVTEIAQQMRSRGIPFTRPWIFVISDGEPTDSGWERAAAASRRACEEKKAVVWPLAVPGANGSTLHAFARTDMKVYEIANDGRFEAIFEWLSTSLGAVMQSQPGQNLQLTAPSSVMVPV
jgi:uncharacterized protein YegL